MTSQTGFLQESGAASWRRRRRKQKNSPQPPFAFLRWEAVKCLGVVLAQKGLVVVLVVFCVVMLEMTERILGMTADLLLGRFTAAGDDAEDDAHQQRLDHPDGETQSGRERNSVNAWKKFI